MRRTTALLIAGAACVGSAAYAGRPLTIDDAEPVAPQVFELEAGLRYFKDTDVDHFDGAFNLAYGLVPRLELGIGLGGQFEEREDILGRTDSVTGFGDLTIGAKGKFLTAEHAWLDHALAFSVKMPTASRDRGLGTGEYDYDLMWVGTRNLGERWNAHANLGYTWVGQVAGEDIHDILHYGLAADYQATEHLQLVAEAFAGSYMASDHATTVFLNGGARWALLDSLILDAAVGTGIRGPAPDFMATVGLTWTFGKLQ